MTPERLAKLKALAENATPGEWNCHVEQKARIRRDGTCRLCSLGKLIRTVGSSHVHLVCSGEIYSGNEGVYTVADYEGGYLADENIEFIAAANPPTVLALIAEVERLSAQLEEVRSRADWAQRRGDDLQTQLFAQNERHKDETVHIKAQLSQVHDQLARGFAMQPPPTIILKKEQP